MPAVFFAADPRELGYDASHHLTVMRLSFLSRKDGAICVESCTIITS